jgi:hypothetical protein
MEEPCGGVASRQRVLVLFNYNFEHMVTGDMSSAGEYQYCICWSDIAWKLDGIKSAGFIDAEAITTVHQFSQQR